MGISPAVETGLFVVVLVGILVVAVLSRRGLLFALGFVLPLMTPRLVIAVGLDWHKLVGPLALAIGLLSTRTGPIGPTRRVAWLGIYATIVTGIWMALEYAVLQRYRLAMWMGLGEAQSFYKMPVQLGTFLTMLAAAPAVPLLARSDADVKASIRGSILGVLTSALFGFALLATTGQGMLASYQTAFFGLDGTRVFRVGGLSGEPKGLGAVLTIVLVYLLSTLLFESKDGENVDGFSPGTRAALVGTLTFGLFMTYSTSAWAGFVGGLVILGALTLLRARTTRATRVVAIVAAAVILIASSSYVLQVAQNRFVDRLFGRSSEVERQKDAFMLQAFEREPWNAVWGYGLGGADLEVVPFLPWNELVFRRPPTAGTTGMKVLGDLGVLGLIAFALLIAGWSRILWKRGDAGGSAFVLAAGFASLFCAHIGLPLLLFLTGARLVLRRASRVRVEPPVHSPGHPSFAAAHVGAPPAAEGSGA